MKKLLLTAVLSLMFCTPLSIAQRGPRGGQQNTEQVRAALIWIRDRMPNLYKLADAGRRPRWTQAVINHQRRFENANAAAKARLMETFKAEDNIYGLVIKLDGATPDQRPAIQEEIRTAARDLLMKNLQERADRIAKLKQDLEAQEKQLNADRENIDSILANRFGVEPTTGPATRPGADAEPQTGGAITAPQP
jgi:hypothetical protein